MLTNPVQQEAVIQAALGELARLRRFNGPPAEFWPAFLKACSTLTGACKGVLLLRDPKQPETWRKMSEWTGEGHADRSVVTFTRLLIEIGERTATASAVLQIVEKAAKPGFYHYALAIRLPLTRAEDVCIAIFHLLNITEAQANEGLVRLQLISDTPSSYLFSQGAQQAKSDVEKFASSLDLLVLVNAEKEFLGASLAFCNGLATRFGCDRVSLGWLEKGYIKLKSISHTERFDRNMAAVKSLETIMEESFDQDEEIIWPMPEGSSFVVRDHERFSREQGVANISSFPLRLDGKNVGVVTCERPSRVFDELDLQQIRLACDQVIRRLSDLKEREGWFGPRLLRASREKLAGLVGPEHTWAKVLGILGALVLAILFFVPVPYRVEGHFILRSDRLFYLTGPFDGFIKEVFVRPGDQVTTNTVLLTLDTNELLLEEAGALADQARYLREAEKARATNGLAEMRISLALADQTKAHLDAVRYRMQQSTVKAPINGVVVEGDLRERIGAPVKQGEALLKVARIDTLYVETEITQRDIHQIAETRAGQIAFVTRPKMKFPIQVTRIEPAAFPKESENIFIVRCAILTQPSDWWRPGMSGLCKISAGKRTLFWILTHRTVDFLRLKFWW